MARRIEVDTDMMPDMTPDGVRHSNPKAREIGRHIHSYESASRFLAGKKHRKLANNTTVQYVGGEFEPIDTRPIGVKLHSTFIVIYYAHGAIKLNSGGYKTVTTKQRINQLLPPGFGLEQRSYEWLLHTPSGTHGFADHMTVSTVSGNVRYHDGSKVTPQVPALPGMTPLGLREKNPGGDFMEMQVFQGKGYQLDFVDGDSIFTPELSKKEAMAIAEKLRYQREVDTDYGVVVGINVIGGRDSWWARYSAPGYLDRTDWVVEGTREEAIAELKRLYGDDDDGED